MNNEANNKNKNNKDIIQEGLIAGVIGWPIKHSRSPLIHGFWLQQYGIKGSYKKIAVAPEDLENFIKTLKAQNISGLNLTIPHKEKIFPFVDIITDDAKAIGAANTLWFEDGKLIAGNTDAYGFITHLKTSIQKSSSDEKQPDWQKDKPAMVIGAGGAARAIIHALLEEGVPEVRLTNRTLNRAEGLQSCFGSKVRIIEWEKREQHLSECSLLVNSTSLGMDGSPPLEMSIKTLPQTAICYDIVYAPLETNLLKNARIKGLQTVDGLGMLLHQAVPGFEKWFGTRPKVTKELRQIIIDDLQQEANTC